MTKLVRFNVLIILCLWWTSSVKAQEINPVHWAFEMKKQSSSKAVINMVATIEEGWYIVADNSANDSEGTLFLTFEKSTDFSRIGGVIEPIGIRKVAESGGRSVGVYEHFVTFQQQISLKKDQVTVNAQCSYAVSNGDRSFIIRNFPFSILIK